MKTLWLVLDIIDEAGKEDSFDDLKTFVDVGDFLGVTGGIKRTDKGELSVSQRLPVLVPFLLSSCSYRTSTPSSPRQFFLFRTNTRGLQTSTFVSNERTSGANKEWWDGKELEETRCREGESGERNRTGGSGSGRRAMQRKRGKGKEHVRDVVSGYRRRYVDLIVNPEVRETFRRRAKIIQVMMRQREGTKEERDLDHMERGKGEGGGMKGEG
eukprot:768431-Hanusia_phi.AAC.3